MHYGLCNGHSRKQKAPIMATLTSQNVVFLNSDANTVFLHSRIGSAPGGEELISAEGTTQGDPLFRSLYAISFQPLITRLHHSSAVKQCWFADDATGSGSLQDVRKWWDGLSFWLLP